MKEGNWKQNIPFGVKNSNHHLGVTINHGIEITWNNLQFPYNLGVTNNQGQHQLPISTEQNSLPVSSWLNACVLTEGSFQGKTSAVFQAVFNGKRGLSWKGGLLFMEESLRSPVEVGTLSHYLQGFVHPRWLFGISSINSMINGVQSNMQYIALVSLFSQACTAGKMIYINIH